MDESHSLEGVKWDLGPNKVTDKGLDSVQNAANTFKSKYVGSVLPDSYEPMSLYVRAQYENAPISSAYAFVMKMYEDTADGMDLMLGFQAIDGNLPITQEELKNLRSRMKLGLPSADKNNVDIYPGNPDLMYVHGVPKNFPEWSSTIQQMRRSALNEFQGRNPNFIQNLKKALDKESEDALTLGNALFYLDYYNMATKNAQTPTRASISGDLSKQETEYFKAFFDKGYLGKDAYNRVLANGYLKHILNMLNLKKQDLTEKNLSDKRIHELKGSLDFGSKITTLAILKTLEQEIDDWGYTFCDTLNFELIKDGDDFTVKSTFNDEPLDLTSDSSNGELDLDKFNEYIVSRMYYGDIPDLQKDSGAENPENHLTRDTADSESAMQWWSNQKKYEDRVLLKATLDTTALDLQSIDKASGSASSGDSDSDANKPEQKELHAPSSSEVTFGSTSESEAATAIATDLTFGGNDDNMNFQFNTLDKIGKFERTSGEEVSLAHGEQVSLGLDNVATKDIQTNLYKDLEFPISNSSEIQFSNAHAIKLDGSEETATSPSGKALQLNHYIPVEVDRLKATITQDNAISLLGANEVPDNHVYSQKVR